jgi:hypothetical protein
VGAAAAECSESGHGVPLPINNASLLPPPPPPLLLQMIAGSSMGRITLSPVIVEKGRTRVALYGLGNIRDERLGRLFQTPGAVKWWVHMPRRARRLLRSLGPRSTATRRQAATCR